MLLNRLKDFMRDGLPLLVFGLLFSFFSSFGQTFLLSLYVPSIEGFLGISNTAFGTIYALATIGSAFTLPWLGGYFDRMDIRRYAIMVIAGLTLSLVLLSIAWHLAVVLVGFYGLRLFGQGLMSHVSVSSMARYFTARRGSAIGVAGLGHPLGEATLPIIVTLIIGWAGWRGSLRWSAVVCLLAMIPLALWLLRLSREKIAMYHRAQPSVEGDAPRFNIRDLIRQRTFWIIGPLVFMLGFSNTAIFFFQLKLGASKGWSAEWVAASISAFAIASAVGMVGSGPLVDRLTGRRIFPHYIYPYLIGIPLLIYFDHPWIYPLSLALIGFVNGASSTVKNALLAETYGTAVIGKVRSVFTTVMVFSTALGPVSFGIMLDAGWSFEQIFIAVLVMMTVALLNGFRKVDP